MFSAPLGERLLQRRSRFLGFSIVVGEKPDVVGFAFQSNAKKGRVPAAFRQKKVFPVIQCDAVDLRRLEYVPAGNRLPGKFFEVRGETLAEPLEQSRRQLLHGIVHEFHALSVNGLENDIGFGLGLVMMLDM